MLQGHALFVRQAGGVLPCPQVDFVGGFNAFFAAAYGLGSQTVAQKFGAAFGMQAMLIHALKHLLLHYLAAPPDLLSQCLLHSSCSLSLTHLLFVYICNVQLQ